MYYLDCHSSMVRRRMIEEVDNVLEFFSIDNHRLNVLLPCRRSVRI